jgi:hypothetical protein
MDWLIASEKFATDLPADVDLISASCLAFPRRITLLTPMLDMLLPSISNLWRILGERSQELAMKRGIGEKESVSKKDHTVPPTFSATVIQVSAAQ